VNLNHPEPKLVEPNQESAEQVAEHEVGNAAATPGQDENEEQQSAPPAVTKSKTKKDGRALGNDAFKRGCWGEALEWYTRAITEAPLDHRLFTNRSTCNLKVGNFHQAMLDANRALELAPTWARAWLRLGQALQGIGEYIKAEAVYTQAIQSVPAEKAMYEAALVELEAARKAHYVPRIAPPRADGSGGAIQLQGSGIEYEEFPLHPAAILDDEGRLEDVVEHPGIDPSRSQGRFVVPVGMPNCTRPYNNDEQSGFMVMQQRRAGTEKFLLVVPLEGLCNRIRVVVDALCLAEDTARSLLVCWQPSPECQCQWDDLFEEHPLITLVDSPVIPFGVHSIEVCQPHEALVQWRQVAQRRYVDAPERYHEYDEADYLVFATCEEFYPGGGVGSRGTGTKWMGMSADPGHPHRSLGSKMLNTLKPRASILGAVQKLPPFTCGVHIRCTDNFNSWHSPMELFFKAMEARIDSDPRTRFFLCTDDPSVQQLVQARYGDIVTVYKKRNYNRRHRVAIEDALIDLLHLAQTEEIIGSYWSSFSEVSSWFRMQPLRIVYRALDKTDTKMMLSAIHARVTAASKYPW